MISNRTRVARSFDFEITRMISDQIALHSVQLPLLTVLRIEVRLAVFFGGKIASDIELICFLRLILFEIYSSVVL